MLSRETKVAFIDWLETLCGNMPLSPKTMVHMMRAFHVGTPVVLMFVLVVGPKWMATLAAFNLFACISLFFVFQGCFLSMLEERLSGDNFTIADPFLELCQWDCNNTNRTIMTYWVAGTYMVVFYAVYYVRFFVMDKDRSWESYMPQFLQKFWSKRVNHKSQDAVVTSAAHVYEPIKAHDQHLLPNNSGIEEDPDCNKTTCL